MASFDPSQLDRDAAFARRLALRLVREAGEADDVVQEAWRTMLEHPPRHEGNLRGYLATIVRRLAVRRRRGEGRRVRREEEAARPEGVPSTAELVERMDVHKRAVAALLELDEPYRTTLLLRFFEDLSPRAIAEREGIPAETVRTRLKRGLARLRAELEPHDPEERREWLGALALLAAPERAAERAGEAAGPASVGGVVGIGLLVVAAATVATLSLLSDQDRGEDRGGDRATGAAATPAGAPGPLAARDGEAPADDARRAVGTVAGEEPTEPSAAAAEPRLVLLGSVRDAAGLGVAGALVRAGSWKIGDLGRVEGAGRAGLDGSFAVPLPRLAALSPAERATYELRVTVAADGFQPHKASIDLAEVGGPTIEHDATLEPGSALVLDVADEEGAPAMALVLVSLGPLETERQAGLEPRMLADSSGPGGKLWFPFPAGYEIRSVQGWNEFDGAGRLSDEELAAARPDGSTLVLPPLVLRRGTRLSGTVTYPDGAPARHLPVSAWRVAPVDGGRGNEGRWEFDAPFGVHDGGRSDVFTHTGEEGRFEMLGLRAGTYLVRAGGGARPEPSEVEGSSSLALVRAGTEHPVLVMDQHRLLASVDVGAERPLEAARVAFTPLERAPDGGWTPGRTTRSATLGDPARAGYRVTPGQRVAVTAFARGTPPREEIALVPERPYETVRVLDLTDADSGVAALRLGSPALEAGAPLHVRLLTPAARFPVAERDGAVDAPIGDLPPGRWIVEVDVRPLGSSPDCHAPTTLAEPVELVGGATRELDFVPEPGGALELVLAVEGEPPPALDAFVHPEAERADRWVSWGGGAPDHARLEPADGGEPIPLRGAAPGRRWRSAEALPAGRYLLRAAFPEHRPVEQWLEVEPCGQAEVLVPLLRERASAAGR